MSHTMNEIAPFTLLTMSRVTDMNQSRHPHE